MMLSDEKKQMILSGLTVDDPTDCEITDPIVFIDASDDPWVADSSIEDSFVVRWYELWDKTTSTGEDLDYCTVAQTDVTMDAKTPYKITKENDPDFIEQVKMALMMRNL